MDFVELVSQLRLKSIFESLTKKLYRQSDIEFLTLEKMVM